MNIKNIIVVFIICIIPANCIELNELIDSYEFNYSSSQFKLNSFEINKLDEQNLELKINITGRPQKYNLSIILKNQDIVLIKTKKFTLDSLNYELNSNLNISNLNSGIYDVLIYILDEDEKIIYRNYNFTQIELNEEEFTLNLPLKENLQNIEIIYLDSTTKSNENYSLNELISDFNLEKNKTYRSDISIENVEYNYSISQNITALIRNMGNTDEIFIKILLLNFEYEIIDEKTILELKENESINITFSSIENLSQFYIISDDLNEINFDVNSSNNIFIWPDNLENNTKKSPIVEIKNSASSKSSEKLYETEIIDGVINENTNEKTKINLEIENNYKNNSVNIIQNENNDDRENLDELINQNNNILKLEDIEKMYLNTTDIEVNKNSNEIIKYYSIIIGVVICSLGVMFFIR